MHLIIELEELYSNDPTIAQIWDHLRHLVRGRLWV